MTGVLLGLVAVCGQAAAQPEMIGGYEIKVRPAGQAGFAGAGAVAVELFRDPSGGAVLAVSDKGQLAVAPAGVLGTEKKVGWLFAHDLKARGPGEDTFTPKTKAYGVEAFKDQLTGKLLFVSQAGGLALTEYPAAVLADKDAKYHHSLALPVRGASEEKFSDKSKVIGVEVYLDGNTGRLVYVTDAGFLAVAPAPADLKAGDPGRKAASLYGRALRVRKGSEKEFTDATAKIGVEVCRDGATGHLLYVTEAGGIAVVPAPADLKTGQGFREERGLQLNVRPAGEADPGKAVKLGVEVLTDNNAGHTVYLTDAGAVAVLPKK
jgi:hypothetical protein